MASNYKFVDTDRLQLTPRQKQVFEMLLPYIGNGEWVTSVSLYHRMRHAMDVNRDQPLSKHLKFLCECAGILEKKEAYFVAFKLRRPRTDGHPKWGYRIKPDLIKEHEIKVEANATFDGKSIYALYGRFQHISEKLDNYMENTLANLSSCQPYARHIEEIKPGINTAIDAMFKNQRAGIISVQEKIKFEKDYLGLHQEPTSQLSLFPDGY